MAEYKAEYLKDYKEPTYEFGDIPWVSSPKIQAFTSVDGISSVDTVQNATLDDHESRIDDLESA